MVGEDVVCVLVGNKTDLLEQHQDDVDQMETDGGDMMTVTLTRFPNRVPTTTAMHLAQVRKLYA